MRTTHSNRFVRRLGIAAISFGTIGLAVSSPVLLTAQDALPAPNAAPPVPELTTPANQPITLADVLVGVDEDRRADVPEIFSQAAFRELLPESWEAWGEDVNSLFVTLYENDPKPTPEQTEQVLDRIRVKLGTLDTAIGDSSYSMIHSELREVRGRLSRQLDLLSAINASLADGLTVDPEAEKSAAFAALAQAVAMASEDLAGVNTGDAWSSFFQLDAIQEIASSGGSTVDAQATLEKVGARLGDASLYEGDQQAFVSRPSLMALKNAIADALAAVSNPTSEREATIEGLYQIVAAANAYQHSGYSDAAAVLRDAITSPDGVGAAAPLRGVLHEQFMGNNFRATVSESLIKTLFKDSRAERGCVNDCVFGAHVTGQQWTASSLSVDLVPSMNGAAFRMTLSGNVDASTRGSTPQATVFTKGHHTFVANKTANFDGYRFSSSPSTIGVNANNNTYAAKARTNIPIVKGIVSNIALKRAREMRPKTEAYARGKVGRQVTSRFDSEVDEMFGKGQSKLDNNLYARLRQVGLYPERQVVSSSDTTLDVSARVLSPVEVAAAPPQTMPYVSSGLAGQLHVSYINNAFDRMNFAGRELTSQEIKAEFERFFEEMLGRDIETEVSKDPEGGRSDAKFTFADVDPMRMRIAGGQAYLIMKAGLKTEGDTIPTQVIEIPFSLTMAGSQIIVESGAASVVPAEAPQSRLRQIASAKIIKKEIDESFTSDEPRQLDRTFDLTIEDKSVPLLIQSIGLEDGWITVIAN